MPAIRGANSKSKTRRRVRDLDQIHADLRDPKHLSQHKDTKAAEDLPALGDFYCVSCAKWFESEYNLIAHQKAKPHRRRLRQLREDPYSQKEAEAAVGLISDNGRSQKMAVDDEEEMVDAGAALVDPEIHEIVEDDADVHEAFFSAYDADGSAKR